MGFNPFDGGGSGSGMVETITIDETLAPVPVRNDGYYYWTGAQTGSQYFYYHLTNLEVGDEVTVQVDGAPQSIRFTDAYNGTVRNADASVNGSISKYTVPEGVDNIYVSINYRAEYLNKYAVFIQRTKTVTAPTGVYENEQRIETIEQELAINNKTVSVNAETTPANGKVILTSHADIKKNKVYRYYGKFSSFTELIIAHGKEVYGSSWIVIDDTNVTSYYYNGSTLQMNQEAHGLTIASFIDVIVKTTNDQTLKSTVTIITDGGSFSNNTISFGGSNGEIFAQSATAMSNVKFSVSLNDLGCDVWIFGDSYISLGDPNRWGDQLVRQGFKDVLLCGFGGASSNNQLNAFRELMYMRKPKIVIWALGMNDPDTTSINTDWYNSMSYVKEYCEDNGIELILCTIPNTPNVNNVQKNARVKNSGLRYIDLSLAVNTSGTSWYSGMLSSDNVHPTELGAKALCAQVLVSVPEIMN